ncbi:MAG TPA: DUF349 domain-containing protein [Chitinophagaceae bacterium]|nr:DUF349 domain-containing protein [Chitinophagaceae bacterium]
MSDTALYSIRDEHVFLPATRWYEERSIAEITEQNSEALIAELENRFKEVFDMVAEVKKEFEASTDKIRLAGKITRTKTYVCNAKAIGDYQTLLTLLDSMESGIKADVDQVIEKREKLCAAVEELLKGNEWKESTEKLRLLQNEFKTLPSVPDLRGEELKQRFEKAKEEFFKLKQASFESFEFELLDNLAKKIELCEKAEALQQSSEWKKTTEAYMAMNEEWKQIGMVPKHRIEEIWLRFNTAKDVFFARKKEHIGDIQVEQEENLVKKLELVRQAEAIKDRETWKETADEYNRLMDEWKKIGKVPQEKSEEVWNAFLEAKNHFYNRKNHHFGKIKVQLEDNHAKKMAIVAHAEALQNSTDFDTATEEYMQMFEEWKKIGRVPKEYGDEAWERFQKAKKHFFDRKDAHRDQRRAELSKDIKDRYERNRSYYNKLSRELQSEESLLFDIQDRIDNLPVTLRSYEKREEYLEAMEEIKEKVNELKEKVKEVKEKMFADEREMSHIMRGPKKKHGTGGQAHPKKEELKKPAEKKQQAEVKRPEASSEDGTPVAETPAEAVNISVPAEEITPVVEAAAEPEVSGTESENQSEPQS